jgi:arylsulfatase A-like enzyme
MGKYLNGYRASPPGVAPATSIGPGWSEWYVPGDHDGYSGFDYTLNENGRLVRYGHAPTDYITDVLSAKGVDFIRRTAGAGKPFLLEVSTFSPHAPYTPAPRHADAYPGLTYPRTPAFDRPNTLNNPTWLAGYKPLSPQAKTTIDQTFRKRAQAVRSVDDLVANLVDTLNAEGLLEYTYIVFSSDNGFHMGEHQLPVGKLTAFDTDINVPLIVAGPGVGAGTTSDAIVANIDLCPTFEELGRGTRTSLVDGRSLVPLLRGARPAEWRKAVLIEHQRPGNADEVGPDDESVVSALPSYHAIRFRDAVYVEYADGQREYYDIAKDPHQLRNLAPQLTAAQRTALHRSVTAITSCRGAEACLAAEKAAHA